LSGTDAAYLINNNLDFVIAQSGSTQFMFVRTDKTVETVNGQAAYDEVNAMISTFTGKGADWATATQLAAGQIAQKLGLAYYEGQNGLFKLIH
jgi:type VI secretion system secreted protein VgrG